MNSKHKYLVIFKDLLETEKKAKDLCENYFKILKDPHLRTLSEKMLKDEEKHMKMAQDLIDLASK